MLLPCTGKRKEKWENDRAVMEFFKNVSMEDCLRWYQDLLQCSEKMLKTTGK